MKVCFQATAACFSLRAGACSAAQPAVIDVELKHGTFKTSVTVISQMAFFSAGQGVSIRLSRNLSLERDRPAGSFVTEMPARQSI